MVRNFYTGSARVIRGESLSYDSHGSISGTTTSGDWTLDGLVVLKDIHASGHQLVIGANRLPVIAGGTGSLEFQGSGNAKGKKKGSPVRITVDFGSDPLTLEIVDAALDHVFLTAKDRFYEDVPDYWAACVTAATTGKNAEQLPACRFSPDLLAVPGVGVAQEQRLRDSMAATNEKFSTAELEATSRDKGVDPPRVIRQVDPTFSDQECRPELKSGNILMILSVDKSGKPRNLQIVKPLGCGMDRTAVEKVATWEFSPATKNGLPIEREIAIGVAFRRF